MINEKFIKKDQRENVKKQQTDFILKLKEKASEKELGEIQRKGV